MEICVNYFSIHFNIALSMKSVDKIVETLLNSKLKQTFSPELIANIQSIWN